MRDLALFFATVLLAIPALHAQQDRTADSELWGGRGISLRSRASGASIEFDCGHGSLTQPIQPDANGEFSVSGTYSPEQGGPVQRDSSPESLPATYNGKITGDSMTLEVSLADKDRQPPPFTLTRGSSGRVVKCR